MENQETLTSEQLAAIEGKPLHEAASLILGKQFPDSAAAAKAMKDTFGYVAKAGESTKAIEAVMAKKGFKTPKEAVDFIMTSLETGAAPVKEEKPVVDTQPKIDPKEFVPRSEFERQNFYTAHPELKGHEKLVETFVKANPGMSRDEVLAMDEFKEAFGPIQVQKQKSRLHSESKIGVAQTKIEEARDKMSSGKPIDIKEAGELATKSVMEAFGI